MHLCRKGSYVIEWIEPEDRYWERESLKRMGSGLRIGIGKEILKEDRERKYLNDLACYPFSGKFIMLSKLVKCTVGMIKGKKKINLVTNF